MHLKEIIFATALLTGACKPSEKTEIQQSHSVEKCKTGFKIPEEIHALEDETRRRILQALNCGGFVLYKADAGAFRTPDISMNGEVVVLEDEAVCIDDTANGIHVCIITALQYQEGTMVNGFMVSGLCAPSEYKDMPKPPLTNDQIDLSEIVKEKVVYENQPPPPPPPNTTNYI